MDHIVTWQGRRVNVEAYLVSRYLWSTASIDVSLDGECILQTGGQPGLTGSYSSTFMQGGSSHNAELKWGKSGFRFSFPYEFFIDGAPVAASRVQVRYAWISMTIKLFIIVVLWYFIYKDVLAPALAPRHY